METGRNGESLLQAPTLVKPPMMYATRHYSLSLLSPPVLRMEPRRNEEKQQEEFPAGAQASAHAN